MERRIFLTSIPGCQNFVADYDSVHQGLLHIIVRHYRQFQKVIPTLAAVMQRLPLDLIEAVNAASSARPEEVKDRLNNVADILDSDKASASMKALIEAQDLLASYFDSTMTPTCYKKKSTTKSGKLQQIFKVKMGNADAELVLGVSKEANCPRIITSYLQKPKKPTPIAVISTPQPTKRTASGWETVTKRKRYAY
uniref:DH domain-containing protein n=1 Tax=Panagrellus redivivus TaxID=6233 RepID=A0A7E4ZU09_PANRE